MARIWVSVFCSLILCSFFVKSASAGPFVVQYSALLTNKDKQPRTDLVGRTVYFRLYSTETGGNHLWQESHTVTTTNTKGFVAVALGSNTPLPSEAIDTCSSLWLEMQIAEESPFTRQRLTATVFSLKSKYSDTTHFAKSAVSSQRANRADSLGNRPADSYALLSQMPTIPSKPDSTTYADTAQFARGAAIANSAISTANLQDSSVTGAKIKNGTIQNEDIAASASISGSKINPIFGSNQRIQFSDYYSNGTGLFMQGSLGTNHRVLGITTNDSVMGFFMAKTPFNLNDPNWADNAGNVIMRFGKPKVSLEIDGNVYSNSNITAENDITCRMLTQTSDRRSKKNIRPLEGALQNILRLNAVSFEWNDSVPQCATDKQIGLIAQDVESVFPEVVSENATGMKSVAYQNLVPVLIEALKEQQNSINELIDTTKRLKKELEESRRAPNLD